MTADQQPAEPLHDCPGGCGREIAADRFACGRCWHLLPEVMRRDIVRLSARPTPALFAARAAAVRWWKGDPL